jgi:hypothetical protein
LLLPATRSLAFDQTPLQLYEQAVNAYERDNMLQALQLIDKSLKLAPDNKQAQKLKQVIEAALHPADAPSASGVPVASAMSDSVWTYSPGDNALESEPLFLHVYHSAEGPTADHAYATMALTFPPQAVEWEAEFKMKIGTVQSVGSGVILRNDQKPIISLLGGADGLKLQAADRTVLHGKVDSRWHDYRMWWRAGRLELWQDGNRVAAGTSSGIPNLLQFGGDWGRQGRQTEAFFQWVGMSYNVPDKPAATN